MLRLSRVKSFAGVLGLAIAFLAFAAFVVPLILTPQVEGVSEGLDASEWVHKVVLTGLIASGIALLVSLWWLYASEHVHQIDYTGMQSQRPIWVWYFFLVLLYPLIAAFLWPGVQTGWAPAAALVCLIPSLQFWLGTLLFSPNPLSIPAAGWLSRRRMS